MTQVQVVNPLALPDWDRLLLESGIHSFFYSASWAKVLFESYHYKPFYLAARNQHTLSALLPLMEVRTPSLSRKGVSLPFTDFCHPTAVDTNLLQQVVDAGIDCGKRSRWQSVEFRGGSSFPSAPPFLSYYNHTLDLKRDNGEMLSRFTTNTRRNIKAASKRGAVAHMTNAFDSIKSFYHLQCATRKRHGLPPQPFHFFRRIYDHIIAHDKGHVFLASHGDKPIAAAIFFHFGAHALFKYGASNRTYHNLRPNNLLMWEAIKFYADKGFRTLDFGRTSPSDEGLLNFKRSWGTAERLINYYKYDLERNAFVAGREIPKRYLNVMRSTPLPILRLLGYFGYRFAA